MNEIRKTQGKAGPQRVGRGVLWLWLALFAVGCAEGGVYSENDGAPAGLEAGSVTTDGDAGDVDLAATGDLDGAPRDLSGESVPCGGKDCNDGIPCTSDQCVASGCQNTVMAGYCLVGGTCYLDGDKKPNSACASCKSVVSSSSFTDDPSNCADDGLACTTASCTAGVCGQSLQSNYCLIGGACVTSGSAPAQNPCRTCKPSVSATAYTTAPDGTSCTSDSHSCTQDICKGGACSHPLLSGRCLIGGACYNAGASQPQNSCQTCEPGQSTSSWTAAANGSACDSDNRSCTRDICQNGGCTHPLQPDTCLIGGGCYSLGQQQPGNPCGECNPGKSTATFSERPNGTACPGGVCLAGSCCGGCTRGSSCFPGNTPADCGAGGGPCQTCAPTETCQAGACTGSGTVYHLNIGAHDQTFSSSLTRGYWFEAPTNFTIVGLRVPTDVGTAPQTIQVMRLSGPPPSFSTTTTSFTTLTYQRGVPGTGFIAVNIRVYAGQVIGVLGARGGSTMENSYGPANTFNTTILGQSVRLQRLLYQDSLYNSQAGGATGISTETSNPYGRIEMQYTP